MKPKLKLKPCPWCGRRPKRVLAKPYFVIECQSKSCAMEPQTKYCDTKEEAEHDWNTRRKPRKVKR